MEVCKMREFDTFERFVLVKLPNGSGLGMLSATGLFNFECVTSFRHKHYHSDEISTQGARCAWACARHTLASTNINPIRTDNN